MSQSGLARLDAELISLVGKLTSASDAELTTIWLGIQGLCDSLTCFDGPDGDLEDKYFLPNWKLDGYVIPASSSDLPTSRHRELLGAALGQLAEFARNGDTPHFRRRFSPDVIRALQDYLSVRGHIFPTDLESNAVPYYVSLRQMASIVNKHKRTLAKLKDGGKLPSPTVKGGNGKADEWVWSEVRPILETEYKKKLPVVFPADRFAAK